MIVIIIAVSAVSLLSGYPQARGASGSVVINEIMYDPLSGESEWIELYNNTVVDIDLMGWTIEDAVSTRLDLLAIDSIIIESYGYICIAQDSSRFLALFPMVTCSVLQPLNNWPRLNNTGDRVVVRDSTGTIIDALEYDNSWGGEKGRSLERINPEWSSNNSASWSTSASPSGSSPCYQNSIFSSFLQDRVRVNVSPDPFDTETTISYRLTVPTGLIKVEIFDIRGRLVRRLVDQEPTGSTGSVIWNGRDDTGNTLRIGVYIVYVEAILAEMGVLDRGKKSVTLARKLD